MKEKGILTEIRLPDYKKIAFKVKRRKVLVNDKEVDLVLRRLQLSRAKISLKKGPAQKGDFVEIEYSASEIEKGRQFKDAFILGKGFFISGFEDNLVGMTANQKKNFSLRFPERHPNKGLAGRNLIFNVMMRAVKSIELPELNDAFAQGLGKFEDLSALKKSIKEGLGLEKEMFETQRRRGEILDKIREKTEVSLPKVFIERERGYLMEDLKRKVSANLKLSFEEFLKRIGKSEKELAGALLESARKRIKNSLILRKISDKEQISVSEAEIKERINETLKNYPSEKARNIDSEALKRYTKGVIIEEKVFQFLENAQDSNNSKNS